MIYVDLSGYQNDDEEDELEVVEMGITVWGVGYEDINIINIPFLPFFPPISLSNTVIIYGKEAERTLQRWYDETVSAANDEINLIIWNEMGILRPLETFPDGPYDVESEASFKEGLRRIAGICGPEPLRCSKERVKPDLNNPYHVMVWQWTNDAVNNPLTTDQTKHFIIYQSDNGLTPNPGITDRWPYDYAENITERHGPFRQPKKATNWYFMFYTGVP